MWLSALLLAATCASDPAAAAPRYLALGDSYTIGESVPEAEQWPVQLVRLLRERGTVIEEPFVIARTGWTTEQLSAALDSAGLQSHFELVSLLIGVNNQYRGLAPGEYRKELATLLDRAIGYAGGRPGRVFMLSIPDWGVTPFAKGGTRDRKRIATEIDLFNTIAREEALARKVAFVDITPISRDPGENPDMIAGDGLHPSGGQYALWAKAALPVVERLLASPTEPPKVDL